MGAWADLRIEAAAMQGIAFQDLKSREYGAVDIRAINAPENGRLLAAKSLFRRHVRPRFAALVERVGSWDAFMDLAVVVDSLSEPIQDALAYAVLVEHYAQGAWDVGGLMEAKGTEAKRQFKAAIDELVAAMQASTPWDTALETATGQSETPVQIPWTL